MADAPPQGWIVDTNVLSRPTETVFRSVLDRWLADNAALIRISVLTLAEMRRGLILAQVRIGGSGDARVVRREQSRLDAKTAWYRELRSRFADRLLPIDADVAERWADVSVRFPSIRDGDKAILATALVHGYGVATRNMRDFKAAGIPLVDPYDPETWWGQPKRDLDDIR